MGNERLDMVTADVGHILRHRLNGKELRERAYGLGVGLLGSGAEIFGPQVASEGGDVDCEVACWFNEGDRGLTRVR